ncbi:MAG TPA: hypothetical protein EYP67_06430 [Methanosarcinales archaeon]|nr:hypothetical protein [Methanosarcinales archaeon]
MLNMKSNSIVLVLLLVVAAMFAGCIGDDGIEVTPTPEPTLTPEPTPTATLTPEPTPTATPAPTLTPEPTPIETVPLNPPKPIYLDKYAMTPKTPTIRAGEALNWINNQRTEIVDNETTGSPMVDFILVSEDGLWENQSISYGRKFKYTFDTPGNYSYYCPGYGNAMRGTVTVI